MSSILTPGQLATVAVIREFIAADDAGPDALAAFVRQEQPTDRFLYSYARTALLQLLAVIDALTDDDEALS